MEINEEINFYLDFLKETKSRDRSKQALSLANCIKQNFPFDQIECVETGASEDRGDGSFGILLAKMAENFGGKFSSVDISPEMVDKSSNFYKKIFPDFPVNHIVMDSVKFLKEYPGSPNIVHLDSYDLDIKNPLPSMLHGWMEFDAIKDKMPSGSICLIDDNYMGGSWVEWIIHDHNGTELISEEIDISYPIIGKGALVFHWASKEETDWDIVGRHYSTGENVKVMVQKR